MSNPSEPEDAQPKNADQRPPRLAARRPWPSRPPNRRQARVTKRSPRSDASPHHPASTPARRRSSSRRPSPPPRSSPSDDPAARRNGADLSHAESGCSPAYSGGARTPRSRPRGGAAGAGSWPSSWSSPPWSAVADPRHCPADARTAPPSGFRAGPGEDDHYELRRGRSRRATSRRCAPSPAATTARRVRQATTTSSGTTSTSGSRRPGSTPSSRASTRWSSTTSTPRPTSPRSWRSTRRPGRRAASIWSSATSSGRSARRQTSDFGARSDVSPKGALILDWNRLSTSTGADDLSRHDGVITRSASVASATTLRPRVAPGVGGVRRGVYFVEDAVH